MDDNEYQLKNSSIKISQAAANTLSRPGANANTKKKGWDDSDDEVEFLKSHNAKEAKINEAAEEEKRKKDAIEEKRNKNLSKFKANGTVLPSSQMGSAKPAPAPATEAEPVKFTNKEKTDSANKFKKGPTNGQPAEAAPQPKTENDIKIVKKDQKVSLKWNEEDRFNEERQQALAKKAELDREIEEEQRVQEEKKKEQQSKIKQAAEKFKPQKKEDAPKQVEAKPEPKVEAQPEPKAEAKLAPSEPLKKTVSKKKTSAAVAPKKEEADSKPRPKLTLAQMKWQDD